MLEAKNVSLKLGDGELFAGLDFGVASGELVCIVGHNGSGKTTLLKLLKGVIAAGSGELLVDGEPVEPYERRVGFVLANPEDQSVCPDVEDDVAFGLENLCLPPEVIREKVVEALSRVSMSELAKADPNTLSGGQLQKVALASVLAMGARYLLLDEATSMLSPSDRDNLLGLVARLKADGLGVVLVTHRPEEVLYGDRVIMLERGSIVFDGSPGVFFSADFKGWQQPQLAQLATECAKSGIAFPGWERVMAEATLESAG